MKPTSRKVARRQLDAKLEAFRPLIQVQPPQKGWIRAIRDALGMTGEQLARRIGTNKQRIAQIESGEVDGNWTPKTMRSVAKGLDCVFVYGFIPITSLEETVGNRAKRVAEERMHRVTRTMQLEQQQLGEQDQEIVLGDFSDELIDGTQGILWDDH